MSHIARMYESCHAYESYDSFVGQTFEFAWRLNACVVCELWMSHDTHVHEICHTYIRVWYDSFICCRHELLEVLSLFSVALMNASWQKYG